MSSNRIQPDLLASDIRASAKTGKTVETALATSQRIIARVTDGIYREPWAAFRELIANSYDADASEVVIETGLPDFEKIVVRDDGNGMDPDTLAYILQNIGGSSKRTKLGASLHTTDPIDPEKSAGGRPLIGKIGIGLFAVAQLTQHFQIITKARDDKYRSSATVVLKTHDELRAHKSETDETFVAGSVTIISEEVPKEELGSHGTTVVLYSLRPEIRLAMQSVRLWNATLASGVDGESVTEKPIYHIGVTSNLLGQKHNGLKAHLPWADGDTPSKKFEKLVEKAGDVSQRGKRPANLEHFDEYFRMLWKLSLSLPLQYVERHPFEISGEDQLTIYGIPDGKGQAYPIALDENETLREKLHLTAGQDLEKKPFSVLVDNVELKRPIILPDQLRVSSNIDHPVMMVASEFAPFKTEDLERAGGELEFEAYLYWNSKIIPKDTTGVVLRVRDASGTLFDASFLNYQVSEQTRLRQITAEIFVKKGLDGAINIDRESYNFSHPHYLYLQRWLHKALRLLVNRLKALAKEKKQILDQIEADKEKKETELRATEVWERRFGKESDPPSPQIKTVTRFVHSSVAQSTLFPEPKDTTAVELSGVEFEFDASTSGVNLDTVKALAIVLEAYGVLSSLQSSDRSKLINDIIKVFEIK